MDACKYPGNTPGTSYRKGCRCERCKSVKSATARKYSQSEAGRATTTAYRKSEKGKARAKKYYQTAKGKTAKAAGDKKYWETDTGFLHRKYHCIAFRCKSDQDYGKRGIRSEFESVEHFIEWALSHPSYAHGKEIHRKNRHGNYSPDNCVFVTEEEHAELTAEERRRPQ